MFSFGFTVAVTLLPSLLQFAQRGRADKCPANTKSTIALTGIDTRMTKSPIACSKCGGRNVNMYGFAVHHVEHDKWSQIKSWFDGSRKPEKEGMADSFVKTFKRDYAKLAHRSDSQTVMGQLKAWFDDYNSFHPHSALGYLPP